MVYGRWSMTLNTYHVEFLLVLTAPTFHKNVYRVSGLTST